MRNSEVLLSSIQKKLQDTIILTISSSDLDYILDNTLVLNEQDTFFSGMIRILNPLHAIYWVQEQSKGGEFLLRQFDTKESAFNFVNQRLMEYEKMWDGCGCKIDYYK